MSEFKLEVVICTSWLESRDRTPVMDAIVPARESGSTYVRTGVRVFDKASFRSAILAIQAGCLGQSSKHAFWLVRGTDLLADASSLGEYGSFNPLTDVVRYWVDKDSDVFVNFGALGKSLSGYPYLADALMWVGFHKILTKQLARKDAERRPNSLARFASEFLVKG